MAITRSGLYLVPHRNMYMNDVAIDYVADTLMGVPVDNSITPNFTTDAAYGTAPYTGAAMLGSTAGGVALTSPTLTVATDYLVFDAADFTYPAQSFTARGLIVYDSTVTGTPLLFLINFGEDAVVDGGDFTVQWHADGIWRNRLVPA